MGGKNGPFDVAQGAASAANTPFRLIGIVQISNNDVPIIADVKWTMQVKSGYFGLLYCI